MNITHLQQNINETTTDQLFGFDTFSHNSTQSHKQAIESSKNTVHIAFILVPVLVVVIVMIISVIYVIYKSVIRRKKKERK